MDRLLFEMWHSPKFMHLWSWISSIKVPESTKNFNYFLSSLFTSILKYAYTLHTTDTEFSVTNFFYLHLSD